MRVDRKQIEGLAEALRLSDAKTFELVAEDGKVRLYAVEVVEKLSPVPLTPQGRAQRERASARA